MTAAFYSLAQWLRRISGNHDDMHGSQKQYDAEVPKPLTASELREGLEL